MEQHDLSKIQKLQEKGKSDKIIKYLSSSDDTVVVAALEALSRIKDEDSVNSIAHMIDNPDTKIRIEAAKALGSIGTEYAKTYLLHRLNAEQDDTVKEAIKEALHTLAEHHSFALLVVFLLIHFPSYWRPGHSGRLFLRNLKKSCDGFCLKPWRITIYNRTVREKSSFVVMEVV